MFIGVLCLSAFASAQALKSSAPAVSDRAPAQPRTITITGGDDMKYSLTTITAKRGETLKIRLTSKGTIPKVAMAHNVVILKPGTNAAKFIDAGVAFRQFDFIAPALKSSVLAQTPFAGPGETVELTFKVPAQAATYPFVCTFAGHFAAGMSGTIVVK
jgi:azurin